jgi:hypothetical protein
MSDDPFIEGSDSEAEEAEAEPQAAAAPAVPAKAPAAGDAGAMPASAAAMAAAPAAQQHEPPDAPMAAAEAQLSGEGDESAAEPAEAVRAASVLADSGSIPGTSPPPPPPAEGAEMPLQPQGGSAGMDPAISMIAQEGSVPAPRDATTAEPRDMATGGTLLPAPEQQQQHAPPSVSSAKAPLDADFFSGGSPTGGAPAAASPGAALAVPSKREAPVDTAPMSAVQAPLVQEDPKAPRPSMESEFGGRRSAQAQPQPMAASDAPLPVISESSFTEDVARSGSAAPSYSTPQSGHNAPAGAAAGAAGGAHSRMHGAFESTLPASAQGGVDGATGSAPRPLSGTGPSGASENPYGQAQGGAGGAPPQAPAGIEQAGGSAPWGTAPKPYVLGGADELPSHGQITVPLGGDVGLPPGGVQVPGAVGGEPARGGVVYSTMVRRGDDVGEVSEIPMHVVGETQGQAGTSGVHGAPPGLNGQDQWRSFQ